MSYGSGKWRLKLIPKVVHSGCDGEIADGSFARNVSAHWASIGDLFFASYGNELSVANIMEVNRLAKLIFAPTTSASHLWRCRQDWMDAGLQPECIRDGDKRWRSAYTMYVFKSDQLSPCRSSSLVSWPSPLLSLSRL